MKERPIIFKSEMVRAILEGRKTQTRREVIPQPASPDAPWPSADSHITLMDVQAAPIYYAQCGHCPKGQPGDRLWVKETWKTIRSLNDVKPSGISQGATIEYAAGGNNLGGVGTLYGMAECWRSTLFMLRWMSRITIEITAVRVDRLNDISEEDAMAEGVNWEDNAGLASRTARKLYRTLWEKINGKDSWAQNPWVWVYEFKKL